MSLERYNRLNLNETTTIDNHHGHHIEITAEWTYKTWWILGILMPLCTIGFASNTVVIWVFVKWRALRDRINLFIVNMAISNLAICTVATPLIALPILLVDVEVEEEATDMIYRISSCLFGLASYANAFATTAISLHRRRLILKPRAQLKNERPQIMVCVIMWGISLFLAIPELFRCATSETEGSHEADYTLITLMHPLQRLGVEFARFLLQFLLVSFLMIFSYVSVFLALRKRAKIRSQFWRDQNFKIHAQHLITEFKCNSKNINPTGKRVSQQGGRRFSSLTTPMASTTATAVTTLATCSNNQESGHFPKLMKKKSTIKRLWRSVHQRKFSQADSKNVCILVATIAVWFACWLPYNIVRISVAFREAINHEVVPRYPVLEGVVLCIAVSSVLHCPIFYTWFNRRNRNGLIACIASIIPCKHSPMKKRLMAIAHQGNSKRWRLPLKEDSSCHRRQKRAANLMTRLQRGSSKMQQREEMVSNLRRQLSKQQQNESDESQDFYPPARHNSVTTLGSDGFTLESGRSSPKIPTLASNLATPTMSLALLNKIDWFGVQSNQLQTNFTADEPKDTNEQISTKMNLFRMASAPIQQKASRYEKRAAKFTLSSVPYNPSISEVLDVASKRLSIHQVTSNNDDESDEADEAFEQRNDKFSLDF